MSKINWKDPGHVLAVFGILLQIVALLFSEFRTFVAEEWDYWLLVVAVLMSSSWGLSLQYRNFLLRGKYDRWEGIKQIKYGHVEYRPFLCYYEDTKKPYGVGLRILEYMLGKGFLIDCGYASSWNNLLDGLQRDKFDIVATPLFETRTRLRKVAFSTPIFFADIGVYMRKGSFNGGDALTHHELEGFLKSNARGMKALFIPGEISHKMVGKYLKSIGKSMALQGERPSVHSLFEGLIERESDIVFAERFVADSVKEVKDEEVVNVLAPKELLYPVGFAMRRQDHVLRNYINIKLMELDDEHPTRLMGFIADELDRHDEFKWIGSGQVPEYFPRKKPI